MTRFSGEDARCLAGGGERLTCADARDRLEALAAGDLVGTAGESVVRRHLLDCVACRRVYRSAVDAHEAFRAAAAPTSVPATDPAAPVVDEAFFDAMHRDVLAAVGVGEADASGKRDTRGLAAQRASRSGRRGRLAAAALLVGLGLGGSGLFDGLVGTTAPGAPSGLDERSALLRVPPQRDVPGLGGGWQSGFGFDDPSLPTAPVSLRGLAWPEGAPSDGTAGCGLGASAAAVELVEGQHELEPDGLLGDR